MDLDLADFFNRTPDAQSTKEKINKMNFIIKNENRVLQ